MNQRLFPVIQIVILGIAPCIALGQSETWSNLNRLQAGQKINVVDMKLKAIEGRFGGFSDDAISVVVGNDKVSIPRADVLSVKNQAASHRKRNILLGLAIGAAAGFASGAIYGAGSSEEGESLIFVIVTAPLGAGIGAGVGAVLPTGPVTVYRAKARSTSNP